jgi:tetratricopeptide (TPR) repeat protein
MCRLRILLSQCLCAQGDFLGGVAVLDATPNVETIAVETRARLLNQKGFALSRAGQFAAAKATLDEALSLASNASSPRVLGEIQINRSTLFFYLAKYGEVETCARAALQIGEQYNLPLIEASGCAGVAKSAMYTDRQAEAILWFARAMTIYEKEGADFYANIMRSELGCCHFALHEDDKAFDYFTQALKASRESGALASLHIDLANMGALHLRRGEYAAALSHFQEALEIARKLGDRISIAKWLNNLAQTYSQMGNTTLAKSYELEAAQVSETVATARNAAH